MELLIKTDDAAMQALEAIASYLESRAKTEPVLEESQEPAVAEFARQLSQRLLESGKCNGMGGCLYCGG